MFRDASEPSPAALAGILRDRTKWPEGHVWNFVNCDYCAMGIARKVWEPQKTSVANVESTARLLGISVGIAREIFGARPGCLDKFSVTPEDIAADLEALSEGTKEEE